MHSVAMNTSNTSRIGTCPHGLPQGACPICSGMGGAGKKADFSAKPGEMSWNECAAIGAFLRAQKNAQMQKQADIQNYAQSLRVFQNSLMSASQRAVNIAGFFVQNTPAFIAKPVGFILNNFVAAPLKMIANIPNFIQNFSNKMADISDKLTAMFGELKNSIEKKISDKFNEFKKKVKSLFSIFKPLDTDNEDKKNKRNSKSF